MAVRRVSDLPNLDVVYPNAQLSGCLFEVSYAAPDTPRRYQSFYTNMLSVVSKMPYATDDDLSKYLPLSSTVTTSADMVSTPAKWPNSRAIIDYIKAQQFLTPQALGPINTLTDLVNMLNALLNTKNLLLFIAQCGVRVSDVITSDKIWYDIVNANNGITLVWKDTPPPEYSQKYYTMHKNDIIFFKTIDDAMTIAQRFKFLQGAGILIYICTDLIEPLDISYTTSGSNVTINSVTPCSYNLRHSDDCQVTVTGAKITEIRRTTDQDGKITAQLIYIDNQTRVIFRDANSLYNSRSGHYVKSYRNINWRYLLFDNGLGDNAKWDNITYQNYSIVGTVQADTSLGKIGFYGFNYPLIGHNFHTNDCSFTNCNNCIFTYGGYNDLNSSFETISCQNIVRTSGGTTARTANTVDGSVFVHKMNNANEFGYTDLGSTMSIKFNNSFKPDQDKKFLMYTNGAWSYVSYDVVKSRVINNQSVADYAVNPLYNALIPVIQTPGAQYNLSIIPFDDIHQASDFNYFKTFIERVTGNSGFLQQYYEYSDILSPNGTGDVIYNGYTEHGYFYFQTNIVQQAVITQSFNNLYKSYIIDRLNPNSKFRKLCQSVGLTELDFLWDLQYYRNNYNNDDHQMTTNINSESFPVKQNLANVYSLLTSSFEINPNTYSMIQWRQSPAANAPNYSWKPINKDQFTSFMNTASAMYGYK